MLPFFSLLPSFPLPIVVYLSDLSCREEEHFSTVPTLLMPVSSSMVPSSLLPNPHPPPPLQVYRRSHDRHVVSYSPTPLSSRSADLVLPSSLTPPVDLPMGLR